MEGDAGTDRLNPTDDEASTEEVTEGDTPSDPAPEPQVVSTGRPSRLGRGWLIGTTAALLVVSAGVAAGGYFALRAHNQSRALAHADVAALQAAKDCVAATHAPDSAAMVAAQQKIIDCATGDFGAQAAMYGGMLVEAYQAANVRVQVSDMRAAVERHNDDGSIEVLVAVRVKVSNTEAQGQEQGYRLRVQMAQAEGRYKIAKLDQVSS
jgi:Mce-associated membrane protein